MPYGVTYDGQAHTAAGTATGVGGANLAASLNLSGTTHTSAGAYPTDTWSFSGGIDYFDANGAVSDSIARATATIVVTPYNVTYDGLLHTAAGTATGLGGANLSAGLNLSGTAHTNAGTYTGDTWSFSGGTNYNDAAGAVNDVIAKATATIVITGYNVIYDGLAHTATGTATGLGGVDVSASLNLTGTTHTNAGTYNNDPWTFTNVNYNNVGGTVNDAIVWKYTLTPLKTPANLGSAVPIIWSLQDASGHAITSLSSLVRMDSVFNGPVPAGGCIASLTGTLANLFNPTSGATGNSSFRYVPPLQFNWDTSTAKTTGPGCYTVKITLNDGTVHITNPLQLK